MEPIESPPPAGQLIQQSQEALERDANSNGFDESFADVEPLPNAYMPSRFALPALELSTTPGSALDLAAQIAALREAVGAKLHDISADLAQFRESQRDTVEKLHRFACLEERVRELEAMRLRTDFINPLCQRVISMVDRIESELAILKAPATASDSPTKGAIGDWLTAATRGLEQRLMADRVDLVNLLLEYGVEPFHTRPGHMFDPKRHENVGVVSAALPEEHGMIHKVVHPGYWRKQEKCVLRHADVRVRVWQATRP